MQMQCTQVNETPAGVQYDNETPAECKMQMQCTLANKTPAGLKEAPGAVYSGQ